MGSCFSENNEKDMREEDRDQDNQLVVTRKSELQTNMKKAPT